MQYEQDSIRSNLFANCINSTMGLGLPLRQGGVLFDIFFEYDKDGTVLTKTARGIL